MDKTSSRAAKRARASLVALGVLGAVVLPASAAGAATSAGRFSALPAGTTAGLTINGVAVLSRTPTGTAGRVVVVGLQPGATYAAHLHNQPCGATNPGGGHYMHVLGAGGEPPNELWFSSSENPKGGITANRAGVAIGTGTASWVATADARAVVIHAIPLGGTTAGGPKIACADLA
jgi:Cu/Zn superoxide dismutase